MAPEYAAGFFDGEGSVYAAMRNGGRSPTIIVCISNTNLAVLEHHRKIWGGSIGMRKKRRPHWQDCYQWVLAARMSRPYLEAIYPHLIIKRDVVAVAIEYCKLMALPAAERIDYSSTRGVKPEIKARIFDLHSQIRVCNSKGYNARRKYA